MAARAVVASESPPPLSALRTWFGHLALVVPLLVALLAASPTSDFRDDVAAVRSLGLIPIGTEGWISTVLAQLATLLPIGGRWLRAAWLSGLALGLASRLLYGATLRLLERGARMPRLGPALALAAALMATLSESFQREGTVTGGASLAAALALGGLWLLERFPPGDRRSSFLWGLSLGLCAAESHAAALSLFGATAALWLVRRRPPTVRELLLALAGFGLVAAMVAPALLIRPIAPGALHDLGLGLGLTSLTSVDTSAERVTAFAAWLDNVGPISFGLAVLGMVAGLLSARLRPLIAPWLVLIFADLCFPAHRASILAPDPFAATRLLGLAALSLAGALGVQHAALALERARLPFSRPAAVMLVAFNFTLVLASSESAAAGAEQRSPLAAEAWTDEALASLAPNSLVIVRSEAITYRLLAAQLARGERGDVVVVPAPLLERVGLRRRLLALEPALAPLLRETALTGKPSEFALGELADTRPLYLEIDPAWDPRLLDHLAPRAFWIRYYAHPLGNSDRRAALDKGQAGFARVMAKIGSSGEREPATRAVLLSHLRERAGFFDHVADSDSLGRILEGLKALDPSDPLLQELTPKLARHAARLSAR